MVQAHEGKRKGFAPSRWVAIREALRTIEEAKDKEQMIQAHAH